MAIINNDIAEYFGGLNKKLSVLQESIAADRSIRGAQGAAAIKSRRPHRQKIPPPPFITVRQLAEVGDVALCTAYSWLSKPNPSLRSYRWRNVLVVRRDEAAHFLSTVQPLEPGGRE